MKKITKKQFLADVRHEIDMLKLHATDAEKSRLDFSDFDPESPYNCIYGQMCGDCENIHAKELMSKACIRVFDRRSRTQLELISGPIIDSIRWVNGAYNAQMWDGDNRIGYQYLSALEGYILTEGSKNKSIISYIKGETNTLTL